MEEVEKRENTKREDRYKTISLLLDDWLPTYGDWFEIEKVWAHITDQGIKLSVLGKKDVWKKLSAEVKNGIIKRRGKRYKFIDPSIVRYSDPWKADREDVIKLKFPISHFVDEYSEFGFDKMFNIHRGDAIVISGDSNEGKTTMACNLLVDNFDDFSIRFISTEMTEAKFSRRIDRMDWAKPLNGTGEPKFEFGFMEADDYEDAIHPDKINIIDWVGLRGDFWQIENIVRDMKSRLRKGMVIIVLQKKKGEDNPVGGEFAYRRADFCLSIGKGVLKVLKAKDWEKVDPNNKKFAFEIVNKGSCFSNIRELETCPQCKGHNPKCSRCSGKGYVEKDNDTFLEE